MPGRASHSASLRPPTCRHAVSARPLALSSKSPRDPVLQGGEVEGGGQAFGGSESRPITVIIYSMLLVYRYRVKSL
jgi:hypothetical protein